MNGSRVTRGENRVPPEGVVGAESARSGFDLFVVLFHCYWEIFVVKENFLIKKGNPELSDGETGVSLYFNYHYQKKIQILSRDNYTSEIKPSY